MQEALSGDIVMRNTILQADSSAPTCGGTITDGGHNLSFPAADLSCDAEVRADPLLGHVDDHGGPTPTLRPASNSPALDAVPASGAFCAAEDRATSRARGAARATSVRSSGLRRRRAPAPPPVRPSPGR